LSRVRMAAMRWLASEVRRLRREVDQLTEKGAKVVIEKEVRQLSKYEWDSQMLAQKVDEKEEQFYQVQIAEGVKQNGKDSFMSVQKAQQIETEEELNVMREGPFLPDPIETVGKPVQKQGKGPRGVKPQVLELDLLIPAQKYCMQRATVVRNLDDIPPPDFVVAEREVQIPQVQIVDDTQDELVQKQVQDPLGMMAQRTYESLEEFYLWYDGDDMSKDENDDKSDEGEKVPIPQIQTVDDTSDELVQKQVQDLMGMEAHRTYESLEEFYLWYDGDDMPYDEDDDDKPDEEEEKEEEGDMPLQLVEDVDSSDDPFYSEETESEFARIFGNGVAKKAGEEEEVGDDVGACDIEETESEFEFRGVDFLDDDAVTQLRRVSKHHAELLLDVFTKSDMRMVMM